MMEIVVVEAPTSDWPELPSLQLRYLIKLYPWIWPVVKAWPAAPTDKDLTVQVPRSTTIVVNSEKIGLFQAAPEQPVGVIGLVIATDFIGDTWRGLSQDVTRPESASNFQPLSYPNDEYTWESGKAAELNSQTNWNFSWSKPVKIGKHTYPMVKFADYDPVTILTKLRDFGIALSEPTWSNYLNNIRVLPEIQPDMYIDSSIPSFLNDKIDWKPIQKLLQAYGWQMRHADFPTVFSVLDQVNEIDWAYSVILGKADLTRIAKVKAEQQIVNQIRDSWPVFWAALAEEVKYHRLIIEKFGRQRYEEILVKLPKAARLNDVDLYKPVPLIHLSSHVTKSEASVLKLMVEASEPGPKNAWDKTVIEIMTEISWKKRWDLWLTLRKQLGIRDLKDLNDGKDFYRDRNNVRVICPHEIALIHAMLEKDNLSAANDVIDSYVGEVITDQKFCKICGGLLELSTNESIDLVDMADYGGLGQDPLQTALLQILLHLVNNETEWVGAHTGGYTYRYCKNGAEALLPFVKLVDAKLAKNRTGTPEERRAKIMLFQYVYAYALIISTIITHPDQIVTLNEKQKPIAPKLQPLIHHFAKNAINHLASVTQYLETADHDFLTSALSKAYSHIASIYQGVGLEPEVDYWPETLAADPMLLSMAYWLTKLNGKVPMIQAVAQKYEIEQPKKRSRHAEKLQKAVHSKAVDVKIDIVDYNKTVSAMPIDENILKKYTDAKITGWDVLDNQEEIRQAIVTINWKNTLDDETTLLRYNYDKAMSLRYPKPGGMFPAPHPLSYKRPGVVNEAFYPFLRLLVGKEINKEVDLPQKSKFHYHNFNMAVYKNGKREITTIWKNGKLSDPLDLREWYLVRLACSICGYSKRELLGLNYDASSLIRSQEEIRSFFNYYTNRCPARTDDGVYHEWNKNVCKYCKATPEMIKNMDTDYYKKYHKKFVPEKAGFEIRKPIFEQTPDPKDAPKVVTVPNLETKLRDSLKLPKSGLTRALTYLGCSPTYNYDAILNGDVSPEITNNRISRIDSYIMLCLQNYCLWQNSTKENHPTPEFSEMLSQNKVKPVLPVAQLYWSGIGKKGTENYLVMRREVETTDWKATWMYNYYMGMLEGLAKMEAWSFLKFVLALVLKAERDVSRPPDKIQALTGGIDEANLEPDEEYQEALPVDKEDRNNFSMSGMDYDGSNEKVNR